MMVGVGALGERNPRNPRKAAGGMSLSAGIAFSLEKYNRADSASYKR
jgi:hypothetical protein